MPIHYLFDVNSSLIQNLPKSSTRHPSPTWLVGTRVLTLYGVGIVRKCTPSTGMHEVQLSYGISYLHYGSILGAESLSHASLEVLILILLILILLAIIISPILENWCISWSGF